MEEGYEPGITFMVAQKRHKTRLFPDDPKEGHGRMRNVPPGTIVDTVITNPTEESFFLVSHEGIQVLLHIGTPPSQDTDNREILKLRAI